MSRIAVVLILAFVAGGAVAQEGKELPLPVRKSVILKGRGTTYTVTGRVTIPRGVEVSIQKGNRILGVGEGATLVVEGSLKATGVTDQPVGLVGVTVELAPRYGTVHINQATWDGGGVRTPPGGPASGMLVLENTSFGRGAVIEVQVTGGSVDLFGVSTNKTTVIDCVPPEGSDTNKVNVRIQGCIQNPDSPGLKGGLEVSGAKVITVRRNRLGGKLVAFRNCAKLHLDMCKVDARRIEFTQTNPSAFRGTSIEKTDFYSEQIYLHAPKGNSKKVGQVVASGCWWRDLTKPREILDHFVEDGEDDETNAARLKVLKPIAKPRDFAVLKY